MNSCCCVALISLLPSLTNQYLCKWYRPSYHDDRPYWKPPTSGEDSSLRYIQEQNQKNLGEVQSMVYQDKLMTTLWKSHLHFTCHLRWSLHSMVLVCLQYVQSVLCVKCVSFYVHLFMYIHPCLVFMDILGKSIFYVIVKKKKKKSWKSLYESWWEFSVSQEREYFWGFMFYVTFWICDPLPAVEGQPFQP